MPCLVVARKFKVFPTFVASSSDFARVTSSFLPTGGRRTGGGRPHPFCSRREHCRWIV